MAGTLNVESTVEAELNSLIRTLTELENRAASDSLKASERVGPSQKRRLSLRPGNRPHLESQRMKPLG